MSIIMVSPPLTSVTKVAESAAEPLQDGDSYYDWLHYLVTHWLVDGPMSGGFSGEADRQAARIHRAVISLECEELRETQKRAVVKQLREVVTAGIRHGLARRHGFALTDRERAMLARLAKAVVAGDPPRAPDANGVRGLRSCERCGVVFEADRANVCHHCRRSRRSQEALRAAALFDRAWWTLVDSELTDDLQNIENDACERCGEGLFPGRKDHRTCSRCRTAAWRERRR